MRADVETFADAVTALLARYARQNAMAVPPEITLRTIGRRLWGLLETRGWPEALAPGEKGAPGEMSAAEVEPLVAHLKTGLEIETSPSWAVPLKQLVKACFHPWFLTCRETYREMGPDGMCRRQEWDRVRPRLSGSHCVDCPYWTTLTPDQHEALLRRHWQPGRIEEFTARPGAYLPEDFRRLRRLLQAKNTPD